MTIKLTTGQTLFSDETICVAEGGTYEPTDLVGCYNADDETKHATVAYQANFIVTGECV